MWVGVSCYVIIRTPPHPYPDLPPSRGKKLGLEGQKLDPGATIYFDGSACLPFISLVTLTFALTRLFQRFTKQHPSHVEFVISAAQ
jgi:hypothetical protein